MVEPIFWVGNPMLSNYFRLLLVLIIAGSLGVLAGCRTNKKLATSIAPDSAHVPTPGPAYLRPADPVLCAPDPGLDIASLSPDAMIDYHTIQYTPISLSECISRALGDSEVFRDLGGTIIVQSAAVETSLDPALRYTNPTFGEDAALSAFDANLVTGAFFENNDRPFNNRFSGDTNGLLTQDLGEFNFELSKLATTGTLFTSRSTINYDANNQAGNRFGSSWEAIIDSGFRHPLLQGSGSLFNRIAGPSQVPGSYSGVLIARTNTEISLADFEESSREFVSNVENAYWDLYYAYRELNAQTEARDAALEVLKKTQAQRENERISGLEQASADEQYLRFESAIIESLEGRLIEGTQVDSGSSGGTNRRTVGVRVAERRLRYIIGMPITDGTLLQPADQPGRAASVFDWESSVNSALNQRPEVRRQRWIVKQKELELTAARNYLLPRLDLVGNYRFRGLGKDLTGGGTTLQDDINNGTAMSSAYSDLSSGNFQEVQIGAELRMPVGFRRAHAGVRNAELFVQREHAILKEQERHIILNLSNAVAEARRSHSAMLVAEKRFKAAEAYRNQAAARIVSGRSQMDVLLEAQRRVLESRIQFINAEVDYVIAIKNVHYEKGTFLQYHGIALSESESNPRAYVDYERRVAGRNELVNYVVRDATIAAAPLANAVGSDVGFVEIVNTPVVGTPIESALAPDFSTVVPMGTGIETPAQGNPTPAAPSSETPVIEIPVDGESVLPPTPTTIQGAQGSIERKPPPTANLVARRMQLTSRRTKTDPLVPAKPVVLTDMSSRAPVAANFADPLRQVGSDTDFVDSEVLGSPPPPALTPPKTQLASSQTQVAPPKLSNRIVLTDLPATERATAKFADPVLRAESNSAIAGSEVVNTAPPVANPAPAKTQQASSLMRPATPATANRVVFTDLPSSESNAARFANPLPRAGSNSETTNSEVVNSAPPAANLVPANTQLATLMTESVEPVPANRVVLADLPIPGSAPGKFANRLPRAESNSEVAGSEALGSAAATQSGKRVYLADIPTSGEGLTPGTQVASPESVVRMKLSSSEAAKQKSTDSKSAPVSFRDNPGFTSLTPMFPTQQQGVQQGISSRKSASARTSDAKSATPQSTTNQIR